MRQLKHKPLVIYASLTVLAALLFFTATNPTNLPSWGLMAGYVLSVAVMYFAVRLLVTVLAVYLPVIGRQRRRLVRLLTAIAALLVAMQSAGQLTIKDMLVLVPLVAIGYFYMTYAARSQSNR